jgi:hypothetical protein
MAQKAEDVGWPTILNATQWSPTQAQWVIAELKRSELSIKSFAAKHKVGLKRIYYWQARFNAQDSLKRRRTGLVEAPSAAADNTGPGAIDADDGTH